LNELGDRTLAIRRELLRRVVEFEDFTRCWESDVMKAKGLVAEIQRTVNVKDSFTRMSQARDQEAEAAKEARERERQAGLTAVKARNSRIAAAKTKLFALFSETDPHKRGKSLEAALNHVFAAYEIPVEEDFRRISEDGALLEQIDGVIEIDDETFLVEMKWWSSKMGPGEVAQHLSRILLRPNVSGIFISNTGYTEAALDTCKDFLQHRLLILCTLQEIVGLLEREGDLVAFIKAKVRTAKLHKKPFSEILEGR
jgi:energy-converting hydrogenase A subunit M